MTAYSKIGCGMCTTLLLALLGVILVLHKVSAEGKELPESSFERLWEDAEVKDTEMGLLFIQFALTAEMKGRSRRSVSSFAKGRRC